MPKASMSTISMRKRMREIMIKKRKRMIGMMNVMMLLMLVMMLLMENKCSALNFDYITFFSHFSFFLLNL